MNIPEPYRVKFRLKTFTVHDSAEGQTAPRLNNPDNAVKVARAIFAGMDADKEHFFILTVNNKNRLTGFKHISTGSLTASLVHPREVMSSAIRLGAAAIILFHNHPSGDPQPSAEDLEITRRLVETGKLIGIKILDHIILGDLTPWSFSAHGCLEGGKE